MNICMVYAIQICSIYNIVYRSVTAGGLRPPLPRPPIEVAYVPASSRPPPFLPPAFLGRPSAFLPSAASLGDLCKNRNESPEQRDFDSDYIRMDTYNIHKRYTIYTIMIYNI